MKLAVVGSRSIKNYRTIEKRLSEIQPEMIISGGADGVDTLAELYAKKNGLPILIFYPDWKTFGKKAGFIRNQEIIDNCDKLIAFWDGESKGTKHSIDLAEKQNKLYEICKSS